MKNKNRRNFLAIAAFVILYNTVSGIHAQAEPDATQIVNKVQLQYQTIKDYKATFVQTTEHKMFPGKKQKATGKLMFKKGGLMRWEYTAPESKYFIYDGATLWVYEPEVPQIFKGHDGADKLKKALAFLTGEGKITTFYTVKKKAVPKGAPANSYLLILTPKEKNSPFKHVELYVYKKHFRVMRSVVVDHDNNRNQLDFSNVKTNSHLSPKLFKFKPPQGVPVIQPQQ
jgi:outer membrane lipoprotein carrier protein